MLTAKEERVLDAMRQLWAASSLAPTQKQIACAAGYKSTGSTSPVLKSLEAKGVIKRDYRNGAIIRFKND